MKNTGVEAQYLRVGDRVQLFDHEGKAAGYATVTVPPYSVHKDSKEVVIHLQHRSKNRRHRGTEVLRRSQYVVVEWRPGIHERDLEKAAS